MSLDSSSTLCLKCRNPLTFQPRVKVDVDIFGSPDINPVEIRELILLSEKDLDDYDAEIAHLQSLLTRVETQKKRVNHYKAQLKSYFSPFRKLPNEIMELIFESACADDLVEDYPCDEIDAKLSLTAITYLPALAISAVCTRWRSLALTLPRLWSQFRLEVVFQQSKTTLPDAVQGGFLSVLQLYLDRSAGLPLQIVLKTEGVEVNQSNSAALNLLFDHSCRWKTFSYTGDYDLTTCEGLSERLSFPILEYLSLRGADYILSPNFVCFQQAPNLHAVKTDFISQKSSLPWNQLTSLDIQEFGLADIHQCHNLISLILRSTGISSINRPMSLAKLESLTFASLTRDKDLLRKILSVCTFSSLGELIITPSASKLVWPTHTFHAFISRSSCNLTSLSIDGVEISVWDLLSAFRILPYLVNFTFSDVENQHPINSYFISRMHAASETLLPKLRTLSLTLLSTSFDDVAFTNMILSRWLPDPVCAAAIGVDCLRSLVLHFLEREVDKDMYRPLYDLNRMGMRVVVVGKSVVDDKA